MDLSRPLAVIAPTLDADVLRVLARADADFTSGQIHRALDGPSMRGIQNTLGRLVEQGIVLRTPAGRAYLHRLNRHHLAADAIVTLANQREELVRRLAQRAQSWSVRPIAGAIFGSAARQDHQATSDIDLLFVRPDDADEDVWDEQTATVAKDVTQWTGNDTRILSLGLSDIRGRQADDRLLRDVHDQGLFFIGERAELKTPVRRPS